MLGNPFRAHRIIDGNAVRSGRRMQIGKPRARTTGEGDDRDIRMPRFQRADDLAQRLCPL